jgi:hypothetical protein
MRSAGTPTATALTVVTLIFAPVLKHGTTTVKQVAKDTTTVPVMCPHSLNKCPGTARMHETVQAPDSSPGAVEAAIVAGVAQAMADFEAEYPATTTGPGVISDGQHGYQS